MNLAEFPLTVLSTRVNPNLKTLEFCDTVKGKNGEIVERKWTITCAHKFGLPTASDDEVLLGLMKLTVDSGMKDRRVYFTRYELLKILRWTTEGRSYSRLQAALDRLSGVRIKAENAFYDNSNKSHSTKNFAIIDEYEINDGRDERPSFFSWSDVMFTSFQVGFIKKLDLDFYLELQSSVSKRLYRYLDKHFWYKNRIQINLFVLAHEKIGISRNYTYASSLRQQLDPAIEELIERGFLSGCEFIGKGKEMQAVFYSSKGARSQVLSSVTPNPTTIERAKNQVIEVALGVEDESGSHVLTEEPERELDLERKLMARGLQEKQVIKLLEQKSPAQLKKVNDVIEYFDSQVEKGKVTNKIAYLYFALSNLDNFTLPPSRTQEALDLTPAKRTTDAASFSQQPGRRADSSTDKRKSVEAEYLIFRSKALAKIRSELDPVELKKLRSEVEKGFMVFKGRLSQIKFEESIDYALNEKLADLKNIPDLSTWLRQRDSAN
jgi:hypothetical protein